MVTSALDEIQAKPPCNSFNLHSCPDPTPTPTPPPTSNSGIGLVLSGCLPTQGQVSYFVGQRKGTSPELAFPMPSNIQFTSLWVNPGTNTLNGATDITLLVNNQATTLSVTVPAFDSDVQMVAGDVNITEGALVTLEVDASVPTSGSMAECQVAYQFGPHP